MKRIVALVLVVLSVGAFGSKVSANDFKSQVLGPGGQLSLDVQDGRFLVMRNFTQAAGATTRGVVSATTSTGTSNVLAAAIIDPSNITSVDVINSVVITGPATVIVTCPSDASSCFVSYRKDSN